jgi:uncharacterized membrane protein YeiH
MTATLLEPVRTVRPAGERPSPPPARRAPWLVAADLVAILLFAAEGALVGIAAGLDVIGVLTVGFVSSLGGGLIRDLLCHAAPPAALRSVSYPATAFLGGAVAITGYHLLPAIPPDVRAPLDAAALGLFCVVGAVKAVDHGMRSLAAVLLGALSAVGGGVLRDVLLGGVPTALRTDVGAVAALCGAGVTVVALRCNASRGAAACAGAGTCVLISLASAALSWQLPPVAGSPG